MFCSCVESENTPALVSWNRNLFIEIRKNARFAPDPEGGLAETCKGLS